MAQKKKAQTFAIMFLNWLVFRPWDRTAVGEHLQMCIFDYFRFMFVKRKIRSSVSTHRTK